MTTQVSIENDDSELELTVEFDHSPAEKATREYPGSDESVSLISATDANGDDWLPDLTAGQRDQVLDVCWEKVADERSRDDAMREDAPNCGRTWLHRGSWATNISTGRTGP